MAAARTASPLTARRPAPAAPRPSACWRTALDQPTDRPTRCWAKVRRRLTRAADSHRRSLVAGGPLLRTVTGRPTGPWPPSQSDGFGDGGRSHLRCQSTESAAAEGAKRGNAPWGHCGPFAAACRARRRCGGPQRAAALCSLPSAPLVADCDSVTVAALLRLPMRRDVATAGVSIGSE